jgi:hypothetical protein
MAIDHLRDCAASGGPEPFRLPARSGGDNIEVSRGCGLGEEAVIMKRGLLIGAGALIALLGVIFTLQGLGAIGGSAMSGSTFWAVAGPVIALAGVAMAVIGLRRRAAS